MGGGQETINVLINIGLPYYTSVFKVQKPE